MLARLLMLCALTASLLPAVNVGAGEYRARRDRVRAQLASEDGLLFLFGSIESERGDLRGRVFQESNFYYLTGWTEPGAMLMLTPSEEFLFLPARNDVTDRYTGRKLSALDGNVSQITGFANVLPVDKHELTFFQKVETAKRIYTLLDLENATPLRRLAGKRPIEGIGSLVFPLRQKKSPAELALLQRSIDVSIDAHLAAWRRATAGLFEYQIAATMTNVYLEAGCERSAYPPIVGAGPNSTILHYNRNSRRMDSGEVLLMDVGGECSMYAADLTRTIPVSGKFSARQREIYNAVLGAQRAAIAAVKPGMKLGKEGDNSLFQIAFAYLESHGKLGKYLTHGLGHHVGLDVHDPGLPTAALEEGNVVTIEPGVYIPEEGIGIRIEDMVLVTRNGARVLSAALPGDPEEIEKFLHARKK